MAIDTAKAAALADEEKRQAEERQKKLSEVTRSIEQLLIDSDCTWEEWHSIIELFNRRNEQVIPRITIKEIKQRYEQQLQ